MLNDRTDLFQFRLIKATQNEAKEEKFINKKKLQKH